MIQQSWLDLATKHAGKEMPDFLRDLIRNHASLSVKAIKIDFSDYALLLHLNSTDTQEKTSLIDLYFSSAELGFWCKNFWDLTQALLNLSYITALSKYYKKPLCDFSVFSEDYSKNQQVAVELHNKIEDLCVSLRDRTATETNIETALQILEDIFPKQLSTDINVCTAACCFLKKLIKEIMLVNHQAGTSLSEHICSVLSEHIKKMTDHATAFEKQAFSNLINSLEARKGGVAIRKQRDARIKNLCEIISRYKRADSPDVVTLSKAQWEGARTLSNSGIPMSDHQTRKKDQREVEEKLGVTIEIVKK